MSTPPQQELSKEERNWAMLCHLSVFVALFWLHIGAILGPLVVWLSKRAEFELVDDQGKESLNFQISILLYTIIIGVLTVAALVAAGIMVRPFLVIAPMVLAFVLVGGILLFDFICVIIAAVAASNGVRYRYPLRIRFIK